MEYCDWHLSPSTFMLRKEHRTVLFQSLTLEALEIDDEAVTFLSTFKLPRQAPRDEPMRATFEDLRRRGFLVTDDLARQQRSAADLVHEEPASAEIDAYRIVLTERCNLACSYCFEATVAKNGRRMSEQTLLDVLSTIADRHPSGTIHLHWFGGEPLLAFDLLKRGIEHIEARAGSSRVSHALTTHGGLVTRERAEILGRHSVSAYVSVDGTPAVHNRHRLTVNGSGTFDDAMRGYARLCEAGVTAGLLLTPQNVNTGELLRSVRFLVEEIGCRRIGINTPQPTSTGWALDGRTFAEQVLDVMHYCASNEVALMSPGQRIVRSVLRREPHVRDCATADGSMAVSISPDGNMGFCIVSWNDPGHSGHLANGDFELARRWKTRSHLTDTCRSCVAEMVCGGPCALEAQLGGLDAQRCGFYRGFLEGMLTR